MKKTVLFLAIIIAVFAAAAQDQDCNITLPFTDSFENDSVLSPCWTVILADTNNSLPQYGVTNEASSDGLNSLMLLPIYSNNYDLYLITPELPVSSTKTLSFDHRGYWFTETFMVGYSTTTSDIADFTWVETVQSPAVEVPWNHYLNLTIPGDAIYIAIHHSDGIALFIDNFVVEEVSSCTAPINLTASAVTSFSADLSWYQVSDNLDITLYYASDDDTLPNVMENVSLTDGIYTLWGLNPGSQYTWMLSVVCDNDTLYSAVSSFTTPCDAVSLPYTQDFDNVAVNELPSCWTQINPYNGFPKVTTSHSHSGKSLEFRCYSSSNDGVYAVLPPTDTDLSELQISFWTRREGASSGTLSVGYMTDLNNMGSFVPIASFSAAQLGDNNYHFCNVPFNNVTTISGTSYFITFKYTTSSAWYWYVDDVTVEEIPDCIAPYDLTVNDVTESSANLSWMGSPNSYIVYYKTISDASWMMVENATLDSLNGFTLSNLLPNTNYQWYVVTVCDDATTMESLTTSSFKTDCGTYVAPFNETFNTAAAIPDCWEMYSGLASDVFNGTPLTSSTAGWEFSNNHAFGENHATLNIQGTSCNYWLVTPNIDLGGISSPLLMFDLALTYHNDDGSIFDPYGQQDDQFMVLFSTDSGATWSAENSISWGYGSSHDHPYRFIPNTGQTIVIPLSDYSGQTIRIAFYGQSTIANGNNDLHIDNVLIRDTPSCMPPTLPKATNITTNSAHLSWSENGSATEWTVEYGPKQFTPGTGTSVTVFSTPSVNINNLQDNATYDFYVTANCSNTNQSESVRGRFTTLLAPVPLPYSTDFSDTADRNWRFYNGKCVNRWTIGNISDSTSAMYITCDSILQTPQYSVTSSSVVSAMKKVIIGTTRDILVSFDMNIGGESQYDFIKVFFTNEEMEYPASTTTFNVDYAAANYSMDASGLIYDMTPDIGQANQYYFNQTGGNTVHVEILFFNLYEMYATDSSVANLVFLWRNDFFGGTQPGAIISNVSVTPYFCYMPDGIGSGPVTSTSAVIGVIPSGTENAWNLEYKKASDSVWTVIPLTSPQYTLSGLTPSTTYHARVQAVCDNGDVSLYFPHYQPYSFTTANPVVWPTPEMVQVSQITQTSASLSAIISNPDNITIHEKGFVVTNVATGDQTIFNVDVDGIFYGYDVTGLTPATEYGAKAYVVVPNDSTIYGNELYFITLPDDTDTIEDHVATYLQINIFLYPNPANDYITVQSSKVKVQSIEVIDVYGKVINTVNVTDNPALISVRGLANGMYFVRVTTDEGTVTKTFVKK